MSHQVSPVINTPFKGKMTKKDAETIAQGKQIIGAKAEPDKKRLRSSSGKVYQSETNLRIDSMATIEEIVSKGGIDHAELNSNENGAPENEEIQEEIASNDCCSGSSQVISLIKNLQKTVDSMNSKISAVVNSQQTTETRVTQIEGKQVEDKKEIEALKTIVGEYQVKVDILSDLVVKQHQEIAALKSQVLDCQIRGMKNNITISGIPEKENENCIRAVNEFIVNNLRIKDKLIPIEQAYRIGAGTPKAMMVTLRHTSDKALIFNHISNLKGQKIQGVQAFVSSQLPEAANEKRRSISTTISQNKKKPIKQRLPYSVKHGHLQFKEKPVEQKVKVPLPGEMLRLTEAQINELNDLKVAQGVHEEESDNMFLGFAVTVTNHTEINEAYKKLKLMHGQATHIACAYRLRSVKPPYHQGGVDDDEHGASRNMLQLLQDGQLQNIAVFMVRYYAGVKLGPRRFELIKKVVSSAIIGWQVSQQEKENDPSGSWGEDAEDNDELQWQNVDQDDASEQAFRKEL